MVKKILSSSLFKSSGIYTVTSVISASIPFLLIPVLTRVFSTEDYGIVSMAALLINIVTPFIGVSAAGAVNRKYFDNDSETNFAEYVGNSFILLILSSASVSLIVLVFGSVISKHTSVPVNWLLIIVIIAICQFVTLILLTIWQAKIKPIKYGLLQILQSILNVGFSLFFIYQLKLGWESRVLGQLLAVCITASLSFYFLIKLNYIKFTYNKKSLKDILSFSLPLVPHTLGGLLIAFTDRILITNMIGVKDTGVYTVAYQIGSVLNLINVSFINAYVPWLYEKLNTNDSIIKIKVVKFTYVYFAVLTLVAIVGSFLLPYLVRQFVGKDFSGAGQYIFWIVLGYVFNGMYLMVAGFIFYVKRTSLLSNITMTLSILNIPLCYIFIIKYGTMGAGVSMSIVYLLSFLLTWYYSNKVYRMPWFTFNKV